MDNFLVEDQSQEEVVDPTVPQQQRMFQIGAVFVVCFCTVLLLLYLYNNTNSNKQALPEVPVPTSSVSTNSPLGQESLKTVESFSQLDEIREPSCDDFENVVTSIETSLTGNYTSTLRAIAPSTGTFPWKRNAGQPYLSYPVLKNQVMYLQSQAPEDVDPMIKKKVLSSIGNLGLVASSLNSLEFSKALTFDVDSRYAFVKNDDLYVLNLYEATSDVVTNSDGTVKEEIALPERTSAVYITCGGRSTVYDDVYDKIINTGVYGEKDVLRVNQVLDSLVELGVSSVESHGGNVSFWMIKNGTPVQLVRATQEAPSCDVIESEKVGKGLPCYDFSVEPAVERVVDY